LFERFNLDFTGFQQETVSGGVTTYVDVTPPPSESFDARIRVLPGRDSSLPIFLDDSMFSESGGVVSFDRDQFELRNNIEGVGDPILTYFSDYVSFDISAMSSADRPLLSNGSAATRVFVSGDNYALGAPGGTSNRFEVLTLDSIEPIVGTYGLEGTIAGRSTPGTYTLRQADPSDLTGIAQITAAAGVWRDSARTFTGFGTFEFILFPTSRLEPSSGAGDNGLRPDEDQELAIVQRNGAGQVTSFYFGYADLSTGEFFAYPIRNLVDASVTGEVTGILSNFRNANGGSTSSFDLVRSGSFTFTGGSGGFPTSGTFTVYRV
jgi:hypothetical protein